MRRIILFAIGCAVSVLACSSSNEATSASDTIDADCLPYVDRGPTTASKISRADVDGIIRRHCSLGGCHGSAPGAGILALPMRDEGRWVAHVAGKPSHQNPSMKLVEPGNPARSWIVHKLAGDPCDAACAQTLGCGRQMPLGESLTPTELGTIVEWIRQGASST